MIGNVLNNDRAAWGLASCGGNAATFGAKTADGGFEEALKNSLGFGSRDDSGGRVNSISMSEKSDDLLGQLQLSFLKSNSVSGIDSRLNGGLL